MCNVLDKKYENQLKNILEGKGNQNEHIKVELEELINFLKLRYNISNIKAETENYFKPWIFILGRIVPK